MRRYKRDMDQIHADMKDQGASKFKEDLAKKDLEDIPGPSSLAPSPSPRVVVLRLLETDLSPPTTSPAGLAQHTCVACCRYFADAVSLETHVRGKPHKRRLKKLAEEPYTIEESRRAVGLGVDKGEYGRKKEQEAKDDAARNKAGAAEATMEA